VSLRGAITVCVEESLVGRFVEEEVFGLGRVASSGKKLPLSRLDLRKLLQAVNDVATYHGVKHDDALSVYAVSVAQPRLAFCVCSQHRTTMTRFSSFGERN
jgi:hypothetical protein